MRIRNCLIKQFNINYVHVYCIFSGIIYDAKWEWPVFALRNWGKPWQKLDMLATDIIMENQLFAVMQNIQGPSFLSRSLQ